jgi:hypothetical protein
LSSFELPSALGPLQEDIDHGLLFRAEPTTVCSYVHAADVSVYVANAVLLRAEGITESNPANPDRIQRKQLIGLTHSVVIQIEPHPQRGEDLVAARNTSVIVPAGFDGVEHGQREEAIELPDLRLVSGRAEQLAAVIDATVPVPVEDQETITPTRRCPGEQLRMAITVEIESSTPSDRREIEAIAIEVENNR